VSKLTYQDVVWLLETLDEAPGLNLEFRVTDFHVKLERSGNSSMPGQAAGLARSAVASAPTPLSPAGHTPQKATPTSIVPKAFAKAGDVTSPMGGMFYVSSAPGRPAFASIGQTVAVGEQVGIIEVMKLLTPVTAPVSGTISAIHVKDQQTVDRDDLLMSIDPSEEA
jgi:acetyl-CoA carboxylase biotin carboxyl carrier protein